MSETSPEIFLTVPACVRLNVEIRGGAWCPKEQITDQSSEWLEIELHSVHVLTGAGTMGRFGNGQGAEYAEAYMLEYWRPKLAKWVRYRTADGQEVSTTPPAIIIVGGKICTLNIDDC